MRSPSVPSCGLFGTGDPERCAGASFVRIAPHSAPRKRQTDFHGRKTGLPPPPMTVPVRRIYANATHTQRATLNPQLFDADDAACPPRLSSTVCPHCAVERLSFSPDADVCELVWRHEGR